MKSFRCAIAPSANLKWKKSSNMKNNGAACARAYKPEYAGNNHLPSTAGKSTPLCFCGGQWNF